MKIVNELLSNEIDYLNALRNAQEMPQPKGNVITKNEQISAMAQQTDISKMETTQTAVAWLVEEFNHIIGSLKMEGIQNMLMADAINQANKMFEEQIKDAYWNGTMDITKEEALSDAEKFYNEYYNKNQ